MESFEEDVRGKYVGVGMVVQKKVNEALTVVSPIEDAPAFKAGIRPRDKVVSIGGVSTYNLTTEECVKKLKGTAGTSVIVKVQREGRKNFLEFNLREKPFN
ncbi:Probable CtpA-like serine protease [Fusobacterium necrophorum subsp. necrophorum]|nr:Probable CtpA-like serine protease [Fusobacterium necrophorum subsp. necrophorum]